MWVQSGPRISFFLPAPDQLLPIRRAPRSRAPRPSASGIAGGVSGGIGTAWLHGGFVASPPPTPWFDVPGALNLSQSEQQGMPRLVLPPQLHPAHADGGSTTAFASAAAAAATADAAAVDRAPQPISEAAAATIVQAPTAVQPHTAVRSPGERYSALLQHPGPLPSLGPSLCSPYNGACAVAFHRHAAVFAKDMYLLMMAAARGRAARQEESMRRREASEEEADEGWWPWPPPPPAEITVSPQQLGGGAIEEDASQDSSGSLERASADSSVSLSPEEREAADVVEVAPELLEFLLDQKMWACFELAVRERGRPHPEMLAVILFPSCTLTSSPDCQ